MMSALCPSCGYDLAYDEPIQIGDLRIAPYGHLTIGRRVMRLTATESSIVYSLMKASPNIVTGMALRERAGLDGDGNSLQVLIHRIRKAFASFGIKCPIITRHGRGYVWEGS